MILDILLIAAISLPMGYWLYKSICEKNKNKQRLEEIQRKLREKEGQNQQSNGN